jgi:hypothetical protein
MNRSLSPSPNLSWPACEPAIHLSATRGQGILSLPTTSHGKET